MPYGSKKSGRVLDYEIIFRLLRLQKPLFVRLDYTKEPYFYKKFRF